MWLYSGVCVCQARYIRVSTLSTICIVVSSLNKAMSENMEDPSEALHVQEHEKQS